jgi:hypothetical protein
MDELNSSSGNGSQQNSPFFSSDHDSPQHDFDDDSKAGSSSHNKKSAKARLSTEKGDAKVLEWASFNPHIIRLKYLQRINSSES